MPPHVLSLVVYLLAATATPALADLQPGPRVEWAEDAGGNGHEYQAVAAPGGITWPDAESWAVAHGGFLATITSAPENTFVFGLVRDLKFWQNTKSGNSKGPWLGGVKAPTSQRPNDGWYWINRNKPFTFTHWAATEPDNSGGREDRLNFYAPGLNNPQATWNDQGFNDPATGFVVDYGPREPHVFAKEPPHLQLPLLIATGLSALIFICGVLVFFFHHPRREDDDSPGPPESTPPAQP